MNLQDCIEEYVTYRRSLGTAFRSDGMRLNAFVKSVGNVAVNAVTPQAVLKYLNGKGPVTNFWLAKYYTLAGFYRFALSRKYVVTVPLPPTKPRPQPSFAPYIFSQADMIALLRAADERHHRSKFLLPVTMRTLLLLLYGSGLRISEALALNVGDVDLKERILTIRETKFYKSRLVPIGKDLHGVLSRYQRDQHPPGGYPDDHPFLVDCHGNRILRQTAELAYKAIREQAGLQREPGFKFYPRLHDLRHTFAVNRLVTWYREGKNVQRLLPHLSTYLGHHSIRATQRYLNLTDDVALEAGLKFMRYALPEEDPND